MNKSNMKSLKLELPDRLRKSVKQWILDADQTQADMLCYLCANLPAIPKLKPNSQLLNYLADSKNIQSLRRIATTDDIRMLELIAKGFIEPSALEKKLIDKIMKDQL